MKLSARQRRFLELAARDLGFSPWDPPPGAPTLKEHEIRPLIDERLASYSDACDVWVTTPKGRRRLTEQRGAS